jgi:uncharacterized protein (DUF1697 family)
VKTYIALFRGINVGGKNKLPMKELVVLLQDFGFENVTTYIQSGNVVFNGKDNDNTHLSIQISKIINEKYGFETSTMILELKELEDVISKNPFTEAELKPESLHLGFLAGKPKNPDLKKLEAIKKNTERFQLKGEVFYLYAPEGVGRSKLASSSERLLGVPMTDRNWRTVCKIRDMANEINR